MFVWLFDPWNREMDHNIKAPKFKDLESMIRYSIYLTELSNFPNRPLLFATGQPSIIVTF